MNIRAATVEDLPAVLEIYNHAVLHSTATADETPQSLEWRRVWFDERAAQGLPVIVAVGSDGAVIGFGALNRYKERSGYRFTVENSLYVAERERGRGVGRALLSEQVAAARRLGMHAIVAGVDGDNAASLTLHRQQGFVEVARLKQVVYKFGRWLDVVYLELIVQSEPHSG